MAFVGHDRPRDSPCNRPPDLRIEKCPCESAWFASAVVAGQLGDMLTPELVGVVGEPFTEAHRARGCSVGSNEVRREASQQFKLCEIRLGMSPMAGASLGIRWRSRALRVCR